MPEQCGGECDYPLAESSNCNRKCCPINCLYSQWSAWGAFCFCDASTCGDEGEREVCFRFRSEERTAMCGGYCEGVTTDYLCGPLCCYMDCVITDWDEWGPCDAQCEQEGTQSRQRYIQQNPQCGGEECLDIYQEQLCMGGCCPIDCVIAAWAEWEPCNNQCGAGNQTRSRYVQFGACGGEECPDDTPAIEVQECEGTDVIDCQVSSWSAWTSCILPDGQDCGEGTRSRNRTLLQEACAGEPCPLLEEAETCMGECCLKDCVVRLWSEWGLCSAHCGVGQRNRTRSVSQYQACGGVLCPPLMDFSPCENTEPQNCSMGIWGNWSMCSSGCGEGQQTRTRRVLQESSCGGICEDYSTEQRQNCSSFRENADCEVDKWTVWSECSSKCDGAVKVRTRNIILSPQCQGTPCPSLEEVRTCTSPCDHECQKGKCVCRQGYQLRFDGEGCSLKTCPYLVSRYCPPELTAPLNCRYVQYTCSGSTVGSECTPRCSVGWFVKGEKGSILCGDDGQWTPRQIYCGFRNLPPLGVKMPITFIKENTPIKSCPVWVETTTMMETYDRHTYSFDSNPGEKFFFKDHLLCLNFVPDYESDQKQFALVIRSTDLEGLSVARSFIIIITNINDAPHDLKLEPAHIPENSRPDVLVGYLSAVDDEKDDITYSLMDSDNGRFALVQEDNGKTAIKFIGESHQRCFQEGNHWCSLNRENSLEQRRRITLSATDNGRPEQTSYFDINIELLDANDGPSGVTVEPNGLYENIPPGVPFATLSTIDEEMTDQNYTYEILNDVSGMFSIEADQIIASRIFDYEHDAVLPWTLLIKSTDPGTPPQSVESYIALSLLDAPETPFGMKITATNGQLNFEPNRPRVKENSEKGTVIGSVYVYDEDSTDEMTVLVSGDDGQVLDVGKPICVFKHPAPLTCVAPLWLMGAVDYETLNQINFTLTATDSAGLNTTNNFTLEVTDCNDRPTDFYLAGSPGFIIYAPEDRADYSIGHFIIEDQDSNDNYTFYMLDDGMASFVIHGAEFKTSPSTRLDYEGEGHVFDITITVYDDGVPPLSFTKHFQVETKDVNEEPEQLLLSHHSIKENSPAGTVVGIFTTEDPDNLLSITQDFWYNLTDSAGGRFTISYNQLLVGSSCDEPPCLLNYEHDEKHVIRVTVTDTGFPPLSREFTQTITVSDVNDLPYNVMISPNRITENMPAWTEIELETTKLISGGDSSVRGDGGGRGCEVRADATYTIPEHKACKNCWHSKGSLYVIEEDVNQLVSFEMRSHKHLFSLSRNILYSQTKFDHEDQHQYSVAFLINDGVESTSKNITIHITNENEPPCFLYGTVFSNATLYPFKMSDPVCADSSSTTANVTVKENMWPIVGYLHVFDFDHNDTLYVSVFTPWFDVGEKHCQQMNGARHTVCSFELLTLRRLDYESSPSHEVEVHVSDGGGLTSELYLHIHLQDVNEAPYVILLDEQRCDFLYIDENIEGVVLASVSALDEDLGQSLTFQLIQDLYLEMVGTSIKLQSGVSLDYETQKEHIVTVNVTDDGSPAMSALFNITVRVKDVVDPPSAIYLTPASVLENSPAGTFVGNLSVNGDDERASYRYYLLDAINGTFTITGNSIMVNTVCNPGEECLLNFENKQQIVITIQVVYDGFPAVSLTDDVIIDILDTNDRPRITHVENFGLGASDITTGSELARVHFSDEDVEQEHTVFLDESSSLLFAVNNDGVITEAASGELTLSIYTLIVTVEDNGMPKLSDNQTVFIKVDQPNAINLEMTALGPDDQPVSDVSAKENGEIGDVLCVVKVQCDGQHDITISITDLSDTFSLTQSTCEKGTGKMICTAEIVLSKSLDYESFSSYELILSGLANDVEASEILTITIQDVNEMPRSVDFLGTLTVVEGFTSQLGAFSASDEDKDDSHSWVLFVDDCGCLELSRIGVLAVNTDAIGLDYEVSSSCEFTVQVTDGAGLHMKQNFTLHVEDVNEPPVEMRLTNYEIPERCPNDQLVGMITVVDEDLTECNEFIISLIDDPLGILSLNDGQLQIVRNDTLCYFENKGCPILYANTPTYTFGISAQDCGEPVQQSYFYLTINVSDTNDPPSDVRLTSTNIAENSTTGSIVSHVTITDTEDGNYTLTLENNDTTFAVIGRDITLNSMLDFEMLSSYVLELTVTDGSNKITTNLTIDVIDENEAPSGLHVSDMPVKIFDDEMFAAPSHVLVIAENNLPNTVVGYLTACDPDYHDSVAVSLTSTQFRFQHVLCESPTSLTLQGCSTICTASLEALMSFDFEEMARTLISVELTDGQGKMLYSTLTVHIRDVNDAPQSILINGTLLVALTVPENTVNHTLGQLSQLDEDYNQTYVFTVEGSSNFIVRGNMLWVHENANLNFEAQPEERFYIVCTDTGDPTLEVRQEIAITVTDVLEPPRTVKLSTNRVKEDAPANFTIGHVSIIDDDRINNQSLQAHIISLLPLSVGSPALSFTLMDSLLILHNSSALNYEEHHNLTLGFNVIDLGLPEQHTIFKVDIVIEDANEKPSGFLIQGDLIAEDVPLGTVVGNVTVFDPDRGQHHSLQLEPEGLLMVEGDNLVVAGNLDFETATNISFNVTVIDDGFPSMNVTGHFAISVLNVNEKPGKLELYTVDTNRTGDVFENHEIGDVIGSVTVSDPDILDVIRFKVSTNAEEQKFKIHAAFCGAADDDGYHTTCIANITLAAILSYEEQEHMSITVSAEDTEGLVVSGVWAILVINKNDAPFAIHLDGNITSLPETEDTFIGSLVTEDEDMQDEHYYTVLDNWLMFSVKEFNQLWAIGSEGIDYETQLGKEVTVEVRSTDTGTPPLHVSRQFTFTVHDVNEAPTEILLSNNEVGNTALRDTVIGYLSIIDPDNAIRSVQNHSCDIVQAEEYFKVNQTDLALMLANPLPVDLEHYDFVIRCTDDGSPAMSVRQDFTVYVVDAPAVPKILHYTGSRRVEENVANISMGQLRVEHAVTSQHIPGSYNYSVSGPDGFHMNGSELILVKAIDYENISIATITLYCEGLTEGGRPVFLTAKLTVDIVDENERPTGLYLSGSSRVTEDQKTGYVIGSLQAEDQDIGQTFTYTLERIIMLYLDFTVQENITAPEMFRVVNSTLSVGKDGLNFEYTPMYGLVINITDSGSPPLLFSQTIYLSVIDANDIPSSITLSNQEVAENCAVGTIVANIIVTDEDEGQTHSCSVVQQDKPYFEVVELTLKVISPNIDFEETHSVVIDLNCVDNGGAFLRRSFVINVTDVNEEPTAINLSSLSMIAGNNPGDVISSVSGTDPERDQLSFIMLPILDHDIFELVNNTKLAAKEMIDGLGSLAFHISLRVYDPALLYHTETFTIDIIKINSQPTGISLTPGSVVESIIPGDYLSTLLTEDEDANQTHTYTLLQQSPADVLNIQNGSIYLLPDAKLDYEQHTEHWFVVRSTDNGRPPYSYEQELTLMVDDVNEPPRHIIFASTSTVHVKENSKEGDTVITMTIEDPDTEQFMSCSVSGSKAFTVYQDRGDYQVVVSGEEELNYEKLYVYKIEVVCTDELYFVDKVLNIIVDDVNEAPENITLAGSHTIHLLSDPDTVIGQISQQDPDPGQKHMFSVVGANSDLITVVDTNVVILRERIPFTVALRDPPTLQINILAVDNGFPPQTATQTFELTVTNIDEDLLPDLSLSAKTVLENATIGDRIADIKLHVKNERSDDFELYLLQNSRGKFGLYENRIVLTDILDYFVSPSHQLVVQAQHMFRPEMVIQETFILVVLATNPCGKTCDVGGKCISLEDGKFGCVCRSGFLGSGTYCENINDCIVVDNNGESSPGNPCYHGDCVDGVNAYACLCYEGFSGVSCGSASNNTDPCASNRMVCENGGVCEPGGRNGYTCNCRKGWTGLMCESSINECDDNHCFADAPCVDVHNTYLCECPQTRVGDRCEFHLSSCIVDLCHIWEMCVPVYNDREHICVDFEKELKIEFPSDTTEAVPSDEIFKALFYDFFYTHVIFNFQPGQQGEVSSSLRRKRSIMNDSNVCMYIERYERKAKENAHMSLYVSTKEGDVYEPLEVLETFVHTCDRINDEDNSERLFCGALYAAYDSFETGNTNLDWLEDVWGHSNLKYIIAAVVSAVVMIVLGMVSVIYARKRKLELKAMNLTEKEGPPPPAMAIMKSGQERNTPRGGVNGHRDSVVSHNYRQNNKAGQRRMSDVPQVMVRRSSSQQRSVRSEPYTGAKRSSISNVSESSRTSSHQERSQQERSRTKIPTISDNHEQFLSKPSLSQRRRSDVIPNRRNSMIMEEDENGHPRRKRSQSDAVDVKKKAERVVEAIKEENYVKGKDINSVKQIPDLPKTDIEVTGLKSSDRKPLKSTNTDTILGENVSSGSNKRKVSRKSSIKSNTSIQSSGSKRVSKKKTVVNSPNGKQVSFTSQVPTLNTKM